ncbi:MAG: hypothetical protein DCC65_12720 [Planctomycetota bacterium]|nr:MAG: hypothetical protein DCC65_12720 [Planctomycetota bacterium]
MGRGANGELRVSREKHRGVLWARSGRGEGRGSFRAIAGRLSRVISFLLALRARGCKTAKNRIVEMGVKKGTEARRRGGTQG